MNQLRLGTLNDNQKSDGNLLGCKMIGCRRRSISPVVAVALLCVAMLAHAQETGLAAFAFTPFSAGCVGGVITGLSAPNTRWNRFGPLIWFACWVLLYTAAFAFLSERPMDVIPTALGISAVWGLIPFVLTFSVGRFFTEKLSTDVVRHGNR